MNNFACGQPINPFIVMKEVELYFHLPAGSIVAWNRRKTTSVARDITAYILRALGNYSYPEIGDYLCRDHKTVLNSCKRIVKLVQERRTDYRTCATLDLIGRFKEARDE